MGDGVVAGAVAWASSGLPSTLHALATGRDVLAAARAAGTLVAPAGSRSPVLLTGAAIAHTGVSLGWAAALALTLPERHTVPAGAAAGLLIAGLGLGVVGRHYPAIAALPTSAQVADHLAFGTVVALVVRRRRQQRAGAAAQPPGGAANAAQRGSVPTGVGGLSPAQ
ncbi:MAG TPA: hypothetical protein VGV63_05280 [Acidimicrobiales bacterium]|nr:hypothetical protein [Acidimicrobiales bacterium]